MSLLRQPQDNSASDVMDRFLHLKAIEVEFARARPNSDLEIKLRHESSFKHKSTVFLKTDPLHWECDIYVKILTKAVLTVQRPGISPWNKVVADVHLDFNPAELADDTTVERKDQASGVSIKLLFGESKPNLEVTRLLADKAVIALATKVSMLDKLNQVLGYLDLVLHSGSGAAQLHPAAQAAVPIVTEAVKKFQEIPACHNEFVFIMDDIVAMLPVIRIALDRITDIEVQRLLLTFIDLTKRVSQDSIEYSSRSASDFLLRNWFQSKKRDVDKLKNQMLHLKLNVGLGLDVDIKGGVSEIQEGVAGNQKSITEIRLHQLSEADEKVLERLRPPEYSSYDPSRCCLLGTRASLLQDVGRWSLAKDHPSRLYWLYGVAGCGKSSVAASVASALEYRKLPFGSFFCRRDIPERRDPIRLIRALTYLLARASITFREVLLRALKEDPDMLEKPLSAQFRALLADRLSEVSHPAPTTPVIIILDALDECDDNKTVSSFLMQMITLAPWLRVFVTSRPFPGIQEELQAFKELTVSCDLFSLPADDDIVAFTRNQFGPKGSLAALRTYVTDAQIEAIGRMASGLFIWIATVLSYISLRKVGKLRVLNQILDSNTAVGSEGKLDALYLQVLNSAASSEDFAANKDAVRIIIGLVYVISRNRPLPANALYAFVPPEMGVLMQELEAVVQDLGSVLTTDPQTNAIRVCHPSFLDFIGSQARSKDFWMEKAKLDTIMTNKCFQIMTAGLKFNICKLESSYLPNGDVDDLEGRVDRCISRELQYSCLYWMNHMSGSEVDISSETSVWRMMCNLLCQTMSLYWLEVLSLLSELKVAGAILEKLIDMHKYSRIDETLLNYITDLYRFVIAFHEPMATSTPHIYISALLWTPTESIIAKSYCLKFNNRHCILEGRYKHWPNNLQTLVLDSATKCIAYSPDGSRIVSGSDDMTVRIWDAHTGTPVGGPLQGHDGLIRTVAFSSDGCHIVSGSDDNTIRVWNAQTGTPVGKPLQGHDDWVMSVAYAPDGRYIVSGSGDKTVRIWDAHSGAPVGEPLHGHGSTVYSVAYSPDGRHIISGSDDETIRIWDAYTGTPVCNPIQGHDNAVYSVAFSPDGHRFVSGSEDHSICIWDAQTGVLAVEPLQGHDDAVRSVAYSPDGNRVISGSEDKTIRIWDAQTGAPISEPLHGHDDTVCSVIYSPDGRRIVSGSQDMTIRIWDARTDALVGEKHQGHRNRITSIAYSPDGHHIVSGSYDKTVRIWDSQTGAPVSKPLQGHDDAVLSVAFSPDGHHIVSGSDDKTVRIWDAQTGAPVGEPLQGHGNMVESVACSPDGRHIISGSSDETIRIWDAQTGAPVGEPLQGHDDWVRSVAYSPDGRHIVSGSGDKTIRIWDARTGEPVGEPLQGHDDAVLSVAFSPDGRRIVSGSCDNSIRIWDVQTGTPIGEPLRGHDLSVASVVCSPDGGRIVSGSYDCSICIWDAHTGIPVGRPPVAHKGAVVSVSYSPDGCQFVSGSFDNSIRIWDAQTGDSVDRSPWGRKRTVSRTAYAPDNSHTVAGSDDKNKTDHISNAQTGTPAGDLSQHQWYYSAYFPDRKCFVSSPIIEILLKAIRRRSVVYSEIPLSIPMDGWIRTLDDGLLLWIAPEYRFGICDTSLICIPRSTAGHRVRVDWEQLCHESAWRVVKDDSVDD